ncbi:hypothetical protein, partial [Cupriavidus pauculus]|uniref:hypothetical protein n=1 Tax=Cupriavidus pauculus TaxID=82633 RepID=UPI0030F62DB7
PCQHCLGSALRVARGRILGRISGLCNTFVMNKRNTSPEALFKPLIGKEIQLQNQFPFSHNNRPSLSGIPDTSY